MSEKLNPNLTLISPEIVTTALSSATSPALIEDPETPYLPHLKRKHKIEEDAIFEKGILGVASTQRGIVTNGIG